VPDQQEQSITPDATAPRGYRRLADLQEQFERAAATLLANDAWKTEDGQIPPGDPELRCDLALEGGGVKGIGLVGAVLVLDEAGYKIQRIAGTSAGAIAASLIAALVQRSQPMVGLKTHLDTLEFQTFMPEGMIHHFLNRVGGTVGDALADLGILTHKLGLFPGTYLYEWLGPILDGLKIDTFRDLKITQQDDPGMSLPPARQYRLVVHVSDITRHELARLPWDYPYYGMDPDDMPVIDAVRASMSIPFFFEPVTFKSKDATIQAPDPAGTTVSQHYEAGTVTWVDGGMLRNFPINAFDRIDGKAARWPTIGVKLSALQRSFSATEASAHTPGVAIHCLQTMMNEWDRYSVEETTAARTIFVDNAGLSATDFHLTQVQQDELFINGVTAATEFIIAMGKNGHVPTDPVECQKVSAWRKAM